MKKTISLSLIVILLLLAAGFLYAQHLPAKISGIVRTKIFECVLSKPYQYMFEPTLPIKNSQHPEDLTEFRAGVQGILFYGDLVQCIGGKGKTWGDLSPIENALGMNATRPGKNGWLKKFYHPEIIDWATQNLIPRPDAKLKGVGYQKIYKKTMRRFFRMMAASYKYLRRVPNRIEKETQFYRSIVGPYQTFWPALQKRYANKIPEFTSNKDTSQLTPEVATAFWIRRHADGTAAALWRGNRKVLKLYDKVWFDKMELAALPK